MGNPKVELIMPSIRDSIKEGTNYQNNPHYNVIYEAIERLVKKIEQLEAENERLKKASQEIIATKMIICDGKHQGDYACDLHIEIAKEALGQKEA